MKITAIIVEDEALASSIIKKYLETNPHIELIGEYTNGFDGLKAINDLHPQIVFLDIEMPKITGLELLEMLGDTVPEIIFTTAYQQHAVKAFEHNATDYLLKPFSKDRFDNALDKAVKRIHNGEPAAAASIENTIEEIQFISVSHGPSIIVIPVEEIAHIQAEDDYVLIFTSTKKYLKQQTLSYYESRLPHNFMRVHRSHIIQLDCIDRLEKYGRDTFHAILKTQNIVPISKAKTKEVKKRIGM